MKTLSPSFRINTPRKEEAPSYSHSNLEMILTTIPQTKAELTCFRQHVASRKRIQQLKKELLGAEGSTKEEDKKAVETVNHEASEKEPLEAKSNTPSLIPDSDSTTDATTSPLRLDHSEAAVSEVPSTRRIFKVKPKKAAPSQSDTAATATVSSNPFANLKVCSPQVSSFQLPPKSSPSIPQTSDKARVETTTRRIVNVKQKEKVTTTVPSVATQDVNVTVNPFASLKVSSEAPSFVFKPASFSTPTTTTFSTTTLTTSAPVESKDVTNKSNTVSDDVDENDIKRRLEKLFQQHNPAKVGDIPMLVEKYKGRYDQLFTKIAKKYRLNDKDEPLETAGKEEASKCDDVSAVLQSDPVTPTDVSTKAVPSKLANAPTEKPTSPSKSAEKNASPSIPETSDKAPSGTIPRRILKVKQKEKVTSSIIPAATHDVDVAVNPFASLKVSSKAPSFVFKPASFSTPTTTTFSTTTLTTSAPVESKDATNKSNTVSDGVDENDIKRRLEKLFQQHNPAKVGDIPTLVEKYKGRYDQLFTKIAKKYRLNDKDEPLEAADKQEASKSDDVSAVVKSDPVTPTDVSTTKAAPSQSANVLTEKSPSPSKSVEGNASPLIPDTSDKGPFGTIPRRILKVKQKEKVASSIIPAPTQDVDVAVNPFASLKVANEAPSFVFKPASFSTPTTTTISTTTLTTSAPVESKDATNKSHTVSDGVDENDIKRRLEKLFEQHNPAKVGDIPMLVEKYKGRYDQLFTKIAKKYRLNDKDEPLETAGKEEASKCDDVSAVVKSDPVMPTGVLPKAAPSQSANISIEKPPTPSKSAHTKREIMKASIATSGEKASKDDVPSDNAEEADVSLRLEKIFEKHNPSKLGDVPMLVKKYKGRYHHLFAKVAKKYELNENDMPLEDEVEKEKSSDNIAAVCSDTATGTPITPSMKLNQSPGDSQKKSASSPKKEATMTRLVHASVDMPQAEDADGASSSATVNTDVTVSGNTDADRDRDAYQRLEKIYEQHNPAKLDDIPKLLKKYEGRHDQLFAKAAKKYNLDEYDRLLKVEATEDVTNLSAESINVKDDGGSKSISHINENKQKVTASPQKDGLQTDDEKTVIISNSSEGSQAALSTALPTTFSSPIKADIRARLLKIYEQYNPKKLSKIDSLIEKYDGREEELFENIRNKYNLNKEDEKVEQEKKLPLGLLTPKSKNTSGGLKGTDERKKSPLSAVTPPGSVAKSAVSLEACFGTGTHKERLVRFYTTHNPSKVDNVDSILAKYAGKEAELYKNLYDRYVSDIPPPSGSGPSCFLEIEIDGLTVGRIEVKLYSDKTPLAAENFRVLCTGEAGISSSGKKLCFHGSVMHRVVPNFCVQGGDFTLGNGKGGMSIYPPKSEHGDMWGKFKDEYFMRHSKAGLLSMANNGPNRNGSQFFFTLRPLKHLDGKHVVFGEVTKGMEIVKEMANVATEKECPVKTIRIADCGELLEDGSLAKAGNVARTINSVTANPSPFSSPGFSTFGSKLSTSTSPFSFSSSLSMTSVLTNRQTTPVKSPSLSTKPSSLFKFHSPTSQQPIPKLVVSPRAKFAAPKEEAASMAVGNTPSSFLKPLNASDSNPFGKIGDGPGGVAAFTFSTKSTFLADQKPSADNPFSSSIGKGTPSSPGKPKPFSTASLGLSTGLTSMRSNFLATHSVSSDNPFATTSIPTIASATLSGSKPLEDNPFAASPKTKAAPSFSFGSKTETTPTFVFGSKETTPGKASTTSAGTSLAVALGTENSGRKSYSLESWGSTSADDDTEKPDPNCLVNISDDKSGMSLKVRTPKK